MSKSPTRRTAAARPGLLWLRQDLRLADNPALHALADGPLLAVFVLEEAPGLRPGAARRWWLHHSLQALVAAFAEKGVTLLLLQGDALTLIPELAARIDAAEVHVGRVYDPASRQQDAAIAKALEADGRALVLHTSIILVEPHRLRTGSGKPYAVYTPFSRAILAMGDPPPPIPAPGKLTGIPAPDGGLSLEALKLLPHAPEPDWAAEFAPFWQPGEAGAQARLDSFMAEEVGNYDSSRNLPGEDGSSRLSPHLHRGEISPRQVWHALRAGHHKGNGPETYLKEILWREFSYHLLWHRPELPTEPMRAEFATFPWQPNAGHLRAWQRGLTGYPIVDAGMRQLWRLGWMHNRVRMVAASLLIKHLMQPWQDGADWFMDTLVDADLASNSANWQWVAGCGTDAAPYFRIFNPVIQGEKFDPKGDYIDEFVPELAALPIKWRHKPWLAPESVLGQAGIVLGETYPHPLVDHGAARARALEAFAQVMAARGA